MGSRPLPFVDLLESAVEQANDGIAVMRFTGNQIVPIRIVYANAAIEALSGFSRRELLEPSNPFLRVQPHNRERYDALFARVRAGESVLFEIELNGRDRSTWCEIRWSPIQFAQEPVSHYIAVIRDISERRAARRNRDLLHGVDQANYGLCILDVLEGDVASRQLSHVNDALCEMLKLSREELAARGLPEPVFSQSLAIFDEDLRGIASVGTIERDLLLRRGDGSSRWFHVTASAIEGDDGTIERLTLTYRDIDDEKHRSADARVLESSLTDALEPVFVVADESPDDRHVVFANHAFATVAGRDRADFSGMHLDALVSPYNTAEQLDRLSEGLSGAAAFTVSLAIGEEAASGRHRHDWRVTPVRANSGARLWLFIASSE